MKETETTRHEVSVADTGDRLIINDRFKSWMRRRLGDKAYAERVMKAVLENENCVLLDNWPHAALPKEIENDPEVMIGMLKGKETADGREFIVGIFGDWAGFRELTHQYIYSFWEMYHPRRSEDFSVLPALYLIAFGAMASDAPIVHIRWKVESKNNGEIANVEEYADLKVNIINTNVNSDVIRLITGRQ